MKKQHIYVFSWAGSFNNYQATGNQVVVQDHEVCVDDIEGWSKTTQENESLDNPPTIMFFAEVSKGNLKH